MSAFNRVLTNFSATIDGLGYAGNVEKVVLPKVAIQTEDFKAGGLDGSIAVDMGTEKLEAKFTLTDVGADSISTWGVIGGPDFTYNFRGALKNLNGSIESIAAICRGRTREIDQGEWQSGTKATAQYLVDCTYYRLEIDGTEVILIDVPNMIRRINGVDQLANIRAALGL